MAGKADLINSIVDPAASIKRLPVYDGWGVEAESADDWGYASLGAADGSAGDAGAG